MNIKATILIKMRLSFYILRNLSPEPMNT